MLESSRRAFLMGVGLAATTGSAVGARAAAAAGPAATTTAPSADLQPLIDHERANIRAIMAKDDIPGVAVCFIHRGKPIWIEGFGVTAAKSNHRVGEHTIFSIQSTSKNFTAMAIMLGVQRGLLDLDEPISTYLPDFTVQSRFDPIPARKMTLRLLLSHRAGFTHEAPVGNNFDPAFPDFETHVLSISRTWLRYPVGERYSYSNLGVDLAGYILQTVSKIPFAECLQTWIFEPLGMTETTAATATYTQRADRALGHAKNHATVPLRIPLIPSGGVYTNARDVAAYLIFHLNKGAVAGHALLEERLWNEMHSFSFGGNYSLGVSRAEQRYGDTPLRMLNHNGGGFGFGCVCNYCPQSQLAWVALFNRQADSGYGIGSELAQALLRRQYGTRRPRMPASDLAPIDLRSTQLESFVGRYTGRLGSVELKLQDGKLGIQVGPVFTAQQFISPVDLFVVGPDDETVTSRYFPGTAEEAAHLECAISDCSLDYNDGPHDAPGPDKPEWDQYLGNYQLHTWGQPSQTLKVYRKNGYLYLEDTRMMLETEPGLFFTTDGEAVDFRYAEPTWRNIRLTKTG